MVHLGQAFVLILFLSVIKWECSSAQRWHKVPKRYLPRVSRRHAEEPPPGNGNYNQGGTGGTLNDGGYYNQGGNGGSGGTFNDGGSYNGGGSYSGGGGGGSGGTFNDEGSYSGGGSFNSGD